MTKWFVGIDPGLVHTGVVAFGFDVKGRHLTVQSTVVDGPDAEATAKVVNGVPPGPVFIEAYRPRSHYSTDARMGQVVNELRKEIKGSTTLDNTGVKRVIRPGIMKAMDVWTFTQRTHHDDLRSAARIGLLGAFKDDELNAVIYQYMTERLDGRPWTIN